MNDSSPRAQRRLDGRAQHIARRLGRDLLTTVLPAVLFALCLNTFVVEAAVVDDGPSMQPNLWVGYRVLTEKVSYRFHLPRRGDIVIAARPGGWRPVIKRVVALPGETIEVRGGHTIIDGEVMREPWVTNFGGPELAPTMVPEGHVFLLGDNRPYSRDSRVLGPSALEDILGRAWLIYWPPGEVKLLR